MLTTEKIDAAEPRAEAYKISDSAGLVLLVTPKGQKWWRIRYRLGGKEKMLSLGIYPKVSLEAAREQRDLIRQQVTQGIDPSKSRHTSAAILKQRKEDHHPGLRMTMDNDGALSLQMGKTVLPLSPQETAELRHFLAATSRVTSKEAPCL